MEVGYINAFVEGDRLVLLYRNPATGVLMQRRVPAEFSSFYWRDAIAQHLKELGQNRFVRGFTEEGDWVRVRWSDYWVRKKALSSESPLTKAGVVAFEGDVDPVRRYLADTGAHIAKPRRAYVDFETDSRVSPRKAAEGEARILSWVVMRDDESYDIGCLEQDSDADERELIEALFESLEDVDQVVAWNGDSFDFCLLPVRIERSHANVKDLRRWLWLDQMVLFERMNRNAAESGDEKQSLKLNVVCEAMIGEGKHDFDARRTYEYWAAGGEKRELMLSYMVQDARLQVRLERKVGHIDLHQTISEVCSVFPDSRGMNPTVFVDGFMLKMAVERRTHWPTKRFDQEEGQQFAGAWVIEPKARGFCENVHVCDFKSLYPSIIITWNMSPETKAKDCPVNGPIPVNTCR